jgi:hypothetical protein
VIVCVTKEINSLDLCLLMMCYQRKAWRQASLWPLVPEVEVESGLGCCASTIDVQISNGISEGGNT